jgi:hypothetical protein
MKRVLVLGALLVAFAGCTQEAASYEGAQEVASAMQAEGLLCEELVVTDGTVEATTEETSQVDSLLIERGVCTVRDEPVVISMFATEEDRDNWVAVGQLFGPVAVGKNWVVSSDSADLVGRVAETLNATVPAGEATDR